MTTLKGYTRSFAITPSDTLDLTHPCQALYIGVAGNVTVTLAGDTGAGVLFKSVPVGILHVSAKRVWSTGTAATDIVGLATN